MTEFHYPLRVLSKKFGERDYKPFAVDCQSGDVIKVKHSRSADFTYGVLQLVMLALAVFALYTAIIEPIGKTSLARAEANGIIASLGGNDKAVIKKILASSEVVSKVSDNGTLQLTLTTDAKSNREVMGLIFGLSGLREVYSDGKSIALVVISSEE